MTSWTEMSPVEFDQTLVRGKARQVAQTAGQTLFPRLLPEPGHKTITPPAQMPGQAELFGEET